MSVVSVRWRDWSLLLLGPLGAILLSNQAIHLTLWPTLQNSPAGSIHYADAVLHTTAAADIVVLGSSAGLFGVDADGLASQTQQRALNLSRNGASLQATAMVLPAVLRLKPSVLVLVLTPLELQRAAGDEWSRLYSPAIAWEISGLSGVVAEPEAHLRGGLRFLSLLARHREWFWRYLPHAPNMQALPGGRPQKPEPFTAVQQELDEAVVDGTGPNVRALQVIARHARAQGTRLVVVQAPLHPSLRAADATSALERALLLSAAGSTLERVPPQELGSYPSGLFADPIHLSAWGRQQLTLSLAAWLQRHR